MLCRFGPEIRGSNFSQSLRREGHSNIVMGHGPYAFPIEKDDVPVMFVGLLQEGTFYKTSIFVFQS